MSSIQTGVSRTTMTGRRGFRTSRVGLRLTDEQTPAVASARGYLRSALPEIYQGEGEFGVRFVGGLETLLDPIMGTLDALHAYFDPDLAPRDALELLTAWLGLRIDESWPDERLRQALRLAAELSRSRGTKRGLELALGIAFPDLPLRVDDGSKVTWSTDFTPEPASSPVELVVYCDVVLSDDQLSAISRVIEQSKPVHVRHRLRVRNPRKRTEGETP
jgi:phage tail-like protein